MSRFEQLLKSWFIPGTNNDYKPHILRNKAILIFAIVVLLIKVAVLGLVSFFPSTAYFSTITSERLVELTNQSRKAAGLAPLIENNKLDQSAYLKAEDILEKGYFNHVSPTGITPWYWFKQIDYNYRNAGENLAIDFIDAESLYQAWFNSPSHKTNLLSQNFKEIGIAVLSGNFNGRQTTIAVQHFGAQFEKPAPVATQPKPVKKYSSLAELNQDNVAAARQTAQEPILNTKEATAEPQLVSIIQEKLKNLEKITLAQQINKTPKVLGIIVEKSEKIGKQIYLYVLLFMTLAFMLNIFIKIRIQSSQLIINGLLIIALIVLLMLLNNSDLIGIGLNII